MGHAQKLELKIQGQRDLQASLEQEAKREVEAARKGLKELEEIIARDTAD